jgi:hypothetical protein
MASFFKHRIITVISVVITTVISVVITTVNHYTNFIGIVGNQFRIMVVIISFIFYNTFNM